MNEVARLPIHDRRVLFTETAARMAVTPIIVEKDFWVCWTLSRLYAIEGMPRLLFKGGTSLSKCFQLIERFSEDIDLGIRREDIGIDADAAPSPDKGSSSQKKARKRLVNATREFVTTRLVPLVRKDFTLTLGAPELSLSQGETESIIEFKYPSALESSFRGHAYISQSVRMEIGARSDHHPTEAIEIAPYVFDHFPDQFTAPRCRVIAQAAERTLLEKALILHTGIATGRLADRSSRHAYDLAMMERAGTTTRVTRGLFEQVAAHKRVFSDDKHAGLAPEAGIRMVPDADLRRMLETDYGSMSEMFFRDPPSFLEIIESLQVLQSAINALPRSEPGTS